MTPFFEVYAEANEVQNLHPRKHKLQFKRNFNFTCSPITYIPESRNDKNDHYKVMPPFLAPKLIYLSMMGVYIFLKQIKLSLISPLINLLKYQRKGFQHRQQHHYHHYHHFHHYHHLELRCL